MGNDICIRLFTATLSGTTTDCKQPKCSSIGHRLGASLVAQWLRIRLPMQGTRGRALVREDPTCRGATHAPQLLSLRATTTEARTPRAHAPQREATAMRSPPTAAKSSPRSLQLKKVRVHQQRPNIAKK